MTEISEAAKAKAGELLVNITHHDNCTMSDDHPGQCGCGLYQAFGNIAGFVQAVSDAAEDALSHCAGTSRRQEVLAPFILPDPVDPFAEAIKLILGGFEGERHAQQYAARLRAELAKRGLKIVEAA